MTGRELETRIIDFAARCVKVCGALPHNKIGSASLGDQLFRSATSVAANYSEANQAESRKDFIHKAKVAVKELNEARTWLRIVDGSQYVPSLSLDDLINEANELAAILGLSISTSYRNLQTQG